MGDLRRMPPQPSDSLFQQGKGKGKVHELLATSSQAPGTKPWRAQGSGGPPAPAHRKHAKESHGRPFGPPAPLPILRARIGRAPSGSPLVLQEEMKEEKLAERKGKKSHEVNGKGAGAGDAHHAGVHAGVVHAGGDGPVHAGVVQPAPKLKAKLKNREET